MAQGKSGRRTALELLGAVLLVLGCALWIFRSRVYEPPAPPLQAGAVAPRAEAKPPPADTREEALVLSVSGPVQRARGNSSWSRLKPGDRLRADESIRTGKGGRTDLRVGDKSSLAVTESTQVTIRELTHAVHRFRLDHGRLSVDYQPDGGRLLKIEGENGVAETTGARFSVLSSGSTVAVATETGTVDLRAADKAVTVASGQTAVASGGAAPAAPAATRPLPAELLLKVAAAVPEKNLELCTKVAGVADRGAEVLVDGVPAPLDREGRFEVAVPRKPRAKTAVLVAMRDVAGHERSRTVPCDPLDPSIDDLRIRWHKKARP